MLVKFTKTVKLKFKNEEKIIKTNSILDMPPKTAKFLAEQNKVIILHPDINENCLQPFLCDWIEADGVCGLIKNGLKQHCLGPYKITPEGILSYLAIKGNI